MRLEDYLPSEPAEVHCETSNGKATLVFARDIRHGPARVWAALTQAGMLPKWAPFRPSRNLDATGPVTLTMVDGSTPDTHQAEVMKVQAGKRVRYSWGENGILDWQIEASANGTRLILRHTVVDPAWITPAAAGWHICLDFAEILLDGHDIGPVLAEAAMEYGWERLAEYYGPILSMQDDDEA